MKINKKSKKIQLKSSFNKNTKFLRGTYFFNPDNLGGGVLNLGFICSDDAKCKFNMGFINVSHGFQDY